MMNRLHNITNPNQTEAKKILCVCSAGLLRSPTTANVLYREFGFNTRSAGLSQEYALIPVDIVLIKWADEIVCMDKIQEVELLSLCTMQNFEAPPIFNLDIPDRFRWDNGELQERILQSYYKTGKGFKL